MQQTEKKEVQDTVLKYSFSYSISLPYYKASLTQLKIITDFTIRTMKN